MRVIRRPKISFKEHAVEVVAELHIETAVPEARDREVNLTGVQVLHDDFDAHGSVSGGLTPQTV
jgi:hypothetical protein